MLQKDTMFYNLNCGRYIYIWLVSREVHIYLLYHIIYISYIKAEICKSLKHTLQYFSLLPAGILVTTLQQALLKISEIWLELVNTT